MSDRCRDCGKAGSDSLFPGAQVYQSLTFGVLLCYDCWRARAADPQWDGLNHQGQRAGRRARRA